MLGPVFLLIYINDIIEEIDPFTATKLFADDCLAQLRIKSLGHHVRLNETLRSILNWPETFYMSVSN